MLCICFYNRYFSVYEFKLQTHPVFARRHNAALCIVPHVGLRIRLEDYQWPSSSWSHSPGLHLLAFPVPLLPSFDVTGSSCVHM